MSENILETVMSTDWRAWLWKTLGEQFNVPALSDCVLLVAGKEIEKKERVYVHKLVLSLHSPILGRQLFSAHGAKQELDLSETERDIDTFTEFMQCLYDNGASITNDNVDTMLGLSRKYQVRWLQMRCLNHIARHFSNDDALFMVISEGY